MLQFSSIPILDTTSSPVAFWILNRRAMCRCTTFRDSPRPIAASSIMTNNIQVTLLAFGLGMTAGLGTCLILVTNGMQLGAVAGWMTSRGSSRALWGWIMPHGGTELLAIVLSGAAGFILASALIAPGNVRRSVALGRVAKDALAIILGVMGMLVVAGLIEGFVSPSSIGYPARIAVLSITLTGWFLYSALPAANKSLSRNLNFRHRILSKVTLARSNGFNVLRRQFREREMALE